MNEPIYLYMFLHCAGFALWSSFWPRRFVKSRLEPLVGYRAYRTVYVAGTIFLLGAALLYLFHHSAETKMLWYLRDRWWYKPFIYLIEGLAVFFLWGTGQLGKAFWGLAAPPSREQRLQTGGYYKISRHPLYWSVFFFFLGHVLVLGSALAAWFLFLMELYNVLGVLFLETPNLVREYGDEYRAFQRRVSTVPFLSLLQGKVKLERGEIPLRTFAWVAGVTALFAYLHPIFIIPGAYYLPELGHVSEKVVFEWHRIFGN